MAVARDDINVIVVDDDPYLIDDYRLALCGFSAEDAKQPFSELEQSLFGAVKPPPDFPLIHLTACRGREEALGAVRSAQKAETPFAVAFVAGQMPSSANGIRICQEIRDCDPDIQIVFVSAASDIHPWEICSRVPPAEKLLLLQKPFHAHQIQQLAVSLGSRWKTDRLYRARGAADLDGSARGVRSGQALRSGLVGQIDFDANGRLLATNDAVHDLMPAISEQLKAGVHFETVERGIQSMVERLDVGTEPDDQPSREVSVVENGTEIRELLLRDGRHLLAVIEHGATNPSSLHLIDVTSLKRQTSAEDLTRMQNLVGRVVAGFCEAMGNSIAGELDKVAKSTDQRSGKIRRLERPGRAIEPRTKRKIDQYARKLMAAAQLQNLKPEIVDLNKLILEFEQHWKGPGSRKISTEFIGGHGLWPVHIDQDKFGNALGELLDNAYEAISGSGHISVEAANIRVSRITSNKASSLPVGDYLRVAVQDSGPGIEDRIAGQAPLPFITSKKQAGHSGLGLSTVQGFVAQSGGFMEISKGEKSGTTVKLFFPKYREPEGMAGRGEKKPAGKRISRVRRSRL